MSILALLIVAQAVSPASTLHLLCVGGGNAMKDSEDSAYAWDSKGNSARVVGSSTYDRGFSDTVALDVDGSTGRIRMPRSMLPKLHGGSEGWFELSDIKVGENEIRASAKVNALNHPKVVLDRIAGTISISGKGGDYAGRCRAYDPTTERRAF